MGEGWLEVVNLEKLINFSRKLVYYNFDNKSEKLNDKDFLDKISKIETQSEPEIEEVLPYNEMETIFGQYLKRKIHKTTKQKAWFIMEEDYDLVLSQMNERMVSNIVRNLVKKGLVESAFDSEQNDFVFWVKKDGTKNKDKEDS